MALDLFSPLKVVSWASAHAECPMRYKINSTDEMVIIFGADTNEFEFALDVGALHALVRLGSEALAEMDACADDANVSPLAKFEDLLSVNPPPPDHVGYQDRALMAEIGKLNDWLGHYILRELAVDALQAEPVIVTDEQALAEAMTTLAGKVLERANRRVTSAAPPTAVEGESTLRRLTNGRPSER